MPDNFLYLHEQIISRPFFEEKVSLYKTLFKAHTLLLLRSANVCVLFASMLAAKDLKISLYVCPASFSDQQMQELAAKFKAAIYFEDQLIASSSEDKNHTTPYLGIFTSGTTGEPKLVQHRWEAIESSSHYVSPELRQHTWLLSYAPWGYAGIQVFFAAWNSQGSIYYRAEHFKEICSDIVKYEIKIISATPTFWKMLIAAWPATLKVPSLLQATLGGEIVDQAVINLINFFFHPKKLTHIYASTEAGTAIVVSDRLAGFPISILEKQSKNGVRLKVIDHELQVLSPVSMENTRQKESWIKTGDLVELKGNRGFFLGRTDGRINIGGRKVCPEEVEQALNALEEIEDSLVYEKKSPIVGSLIAADLIIKTSHHFDIPEIKKKLKSLIEEYKIPHFIRRVNHFAISSTGKKIRS